MKSAQEVAREILEILVHYDSWRDNLHIDGFPNTIEAIVNVLESFAADRVREEREVIKNETI